MAHFSIFKQMILGQTNLESQIYSELNEVVLIKVQNNNTPNALVTTVKSVLQL